MTIKTMPHATAKTSLKRTPVPRLKLLDSCVAQATSKEDAMTTTVSTKFVPTALAAAAIGLGALMTVGAPTAHASQRSDCENKGGTFTETTIFDNKTGKSGTTYRCCVKDAKTNTTSCTSTTVTNNTRIPVNVRPGLIDTAETIEPAPPIQRVPVDVVNTDAHIEPAP
jgi:hypothetical protein